MARIIITLSPPLFYFFFFSLFSHQIMSQPRHMYTFCNTKDSFRPNSAYETNRNLVLSSLSVTSSLGTYSNVTFGTGVLSKVRGMYLCRGDLNTTTCSNCVQTATIEIAKNCTVNKEAFIFYYECMVRYSDNAFFSDLEVRPNIVNHSPESAPNPNGFNQTLSDKFNKLILNVSSSPSSPIPYFVEDEELVTHSEGSYELSSLAQCSPDLDPLNCGVCLRFMFDRVSTCCGLPKASFVFGPKCLLAYSTSVLSSSPPSSPLSPPPLIPPSSPSSPPLFLPPQSPSQKQPPPLVFTPPQNVPSGSFSSNIVKGNEVFGRIVVTMTVLVFALVDM